MFYLTHLFKFLITVPVRSLCYILVSGVLIVSSYNQNTINRHISSFGESDRKLPYFHALVSGRENHSRISRNLQNLPGVEKVEILAEQKIREQVEQIVGSLSSELTESFFSLNYAGLKIIFSEGLQGNSIELIRDYLKRLVGETKVTLGPVQLQNRKEREVSFLWRIFQDHTFYSLMFLVAFVWLSLGSALAIPWRKHAHLIEQFQRREKVAFKSFLLLNIIIFGLFSLVGLTMGAPTGLVAIILLLGSAPCLLTLRKVSWH